MSEVDPIPDHFQKLITEGGQVKSHVRFRQALEGRKLEILLSPEDLERLNSGQGLGVTMDEEDAEWDGEEHVTYRNNADESFKVVKITIGKRYG